MDIAPLQRQELDLIDELLANLIDGVGQENRGPIQNLRDQLESWSARISVIGQVKAGKSTFLNAFLHERDFLPSDVNPWTTVVTNIRINNKADPKTGARFDFFDEKDWDEIINGQSEIRQMTETMLPGFDADVLRKQTEEMRERAQQRLGSHYHTLLGQSHTYDFLNSDLMRRYVCAGDGGDADQDAAGRYALITKVANAYMRRPEFKVPIILTDTPGVNDPFLVRDEFTCRSLDKSDIFVVVLSAHQPLTNVDIALIKLLASQQTKDVVIFINRIDELDDFADDVKNVVDDVSSRLKEAIPGMAFTIIAGSAFMAEVAERSDDEAAALRDELDSPELSAYLQSKNGCVPVDQIDRLWAGSGLDDVKAALSRFIDNGVGSNRLAKIVEDTRAEIGAMSLSIKRERESVHEQMSRVTSTDADGAIEALEKEIQCLSEIAGSLDELVEDSGSTIERLVEKSWSDLEKKLTGSAAEFFENQHQQLNDKFVRLSMSKSVDKEVRIDLTDVLQNFDNHIKRSFNKSRATIDVTLDNCLSGCRSRIESEFSSLLEGITLDDLPHQEFSSTVAFVKKEICVPIVGEKGWAFWRKSKVNERKTIDAFKSVANAELAQMVQKIVQVFNEAQVERATEGLERIRVMLRMVDVAVAERSKRLRRDRRLMENQTQNDQNLVSIEDRLHSQLEYLDRRIQTLSIAEAALTRTVMSYAA